ncbi:MAG: hypothetical protein IIZ67_03940 [Bacilli bacterium]|nr:hypothetical protein [Bacilli bacterium]
MEKIIKKIFTLCFLLTFIIFGIITLLDAYKKDTIINIMYNSDEIFIDNMTPNTKRILLFPRYCWNKLLNKRFYFDDSTYITKDKNIIKGSHNEENLEFSINNIKKINDYAKKNKINFLYVILPGKPLYDEELTNKNISCYRNKNADNFIKELKNNSIPYIDLRDSFRKSKENPYDWFYKTDHHWNSDAGLEAARLITNELNNKYKLKLNSENLKPSKFERKVYQNYWVGENGNKIYGSELEKEDFIVNIPSYRNHISVNNETTNIKEEGDFSVLLNEKRLKEYDVFKEGSLYYYYLSYNEYIVDIKNHNNKNGNILYIKDSYSTVVIPFLALSASHITSWDIRSGSNLYSYLNSHKKYDTIIVAYTISSIPKDSMNDFK